MEWSLFDGRGRRKYLVPSERTAFLKAAIAEGGETGSFCVVLAYTGARVSEVLARAPLDLDEGNGTVNIESLKRRRKGVIRAVPVPADLFGYLDGIHHWREAQTNPTAASGRLWSFSRSTAWRRVKHIAAAANIPEHLRTPKALRHGLAVDARIKGVPVELIKTSLGHARIETTFIYTTVIGPEERDFFGRTWHETRELIGSAVA